VEYVLRPATEEERGVGDEGSPRLARHRAAEQRDDVVGDARQDLEDDLLRERSRDHGRVGCLLPPRGHENSVHGIGGKLQIGVVWNWAGVRVKAHAFILRNGESSSATTLYIYGNIITPIYWETFIT
jgi:hypothetical protein